MAYIKYSASRVNIIVDSLLKPYEKELTQIAKRRKDNYPGVKNKYFDERSLVWKIDEAELEKLRPLLDLKN